MNSYLALRMPILCVTNFRDSLLSGAIYAFNLNILKHNLFRPDLNRASQ